PETCSAQALQGYRQKRHTTRNRGRGMAEETEKERINREIIELLNEVRVTLPGVQVLFAFLLILPFQPRFGNLTDLERDAYLLALTFATATVAFFIAPA